MNDFDLFAILPHMHQTGVHMRFLYTPPDGEQAPQLVSSLWIGVVVDPRLHPRLEACPCVVAGHGANVLSPPGARRASAL